MLYSSSKNSISTKIDCEFDFIFATTLEELLQSMDPHPQQIDVRTEIEKQQEKTILELARSQPSQPSHSSSLSFPITKEALVIKNIKKSLISQQTPEMLIILV